MTEMKIVSVLLEDETLEKIIQVQKDTNNFSRSDVLRILIKKGLEQVEAR